MIYLRMAFINFRAEQRWMPRKMETRLGDLTEQDIEALIHFYGSGADLHDSR